MDNGTILLVAAVAAAALVLLALTRKVPRPTKIAALALCGVVLGVALTLAGMAYLRPHNDLAMSTCVSFTAENEYPNLSDQEAEVRANQECEEQEAKDPELFTAVWVS